MTTTRYNTQDATKPVAASALNRFASFVHRLATDPDALDQLVADFSRPGSGEAYAAFVLHGIEAAPSSDLIDAFEDAYVDSYASWRHLHEKLPNHPTILDPISDKEMDELWELPLLELPEEIEAVIQRRLERSYQIIADTNGTIHLFMYLA